jgi:uncharacterized protein (TIGR02594 family)
MSTISDKISKPTDTLKMGMQGELVKLAQQELAKRGYALKGTGYFGAATDTVVETFQKRAGLKSDGELGPTTAKAIDAAPLTNSLAPIAKEEISRPLWLEAGIKLIGTKETIGSKDTKAIIDWAKEEGGSISETYTHDSIPWCALFANHILTKVGLKGTETLWALDFAGKWPSIKLAGPAVGAFAPMLRNGGGHIIVVVGKDQHGNIMGLGGNQKDQVSIVPFPVSRLNKGFWWPKEASQPWDVGLKYLPIVKSDGKLSTNEA